VVVFGMKGDECMGRLSYVSYYEGNVDFIKQIISTLDKTCENKESESFNMGKKFGASNTYTIQCNYNDYSIEFDISVKEIFEKCIDVNQLGSVIENIIQSKIDTGLAKKL
jgi:hypothetical protein